MPTGLEKLMDTARTAKPVVESARLPRMSDRPPKPTPIGGKILRMPGEPAPDRGTAKRMAKPPARPAREVRRRGEPPEMQRRKETAQPAAGYVRLRLHVEDGEVSVVGAKAVEGPLVEDLRLHGDLAYEVSLRGKRLAAGAVPDVGVMRSFPPPKESGEVRGHYISAATSYEVAVRVPKERLTPASLARLEIGLFKLKEDVAHVPPAPARLEETLGRELREVARVKGIKLDRLPRPVQTELRRAIG